MKNCDNCRYDAWDYVGTKPCGECNSGKDAPTMWEAGANYEPPTNADRIRAMSDEDLAYWIMCPYDSPYCDGTEHNCIECTKEWLNSPAEGE